MLKPPDSTSEIAALLQPKERILWNGRPYGGIVFQAQDAPFVIPAVFFFGATATGVAAGITAEKVEAPLAAVAVFGSFFLIGCYFAFGRLFVNARFRSKWLYAITSERAITISGISTRAVRSVYLAKMAETILIEKDNGWGTIILGPVFPWEQTFGRDAAAPDFEYLEGVRGVYDILSEARRTAKQEHATSID